MTSSMQQTLALYRDLQFECEIVEQNKSHGGKRWKHDCFNIADILAVHKEGRVIGTVYIQVTDTHNHAAHILKIMAAGATRSILLCGNHIHLVSYGVSKPRRITAFCIPADERNSIRPVEIDMPTDDDRWTLPKPLQ